MFTAPRRKSISRFSKIVENDENFNFVASNENIKELEVCKLKKYFYFYFIIFIYTEESWSLVLYVCEKRAL